MFDITSSKLLLLGIVALLVIGAKDFPVLLRTIGKYVGIIRGHAKEFRAQFDEAIRETELADLKKDVEKIAQETEASFSAASQSVEGTIDDARRTMDVSLDPLAPLPSPLTDPLADPLAHDANGMPIAPPQPTPAIAAPAGTNGASGAVEQPASAGAETAAAAPAPAEPAPAAKSGA
jgi:sec-independent protein translocase protein TatB